MSARTAEKLNIRLKEVKIKIKTANGSEMHALGEAKLGFEIEDKLFTDDCIIVHDLA